MYVYYKVLPQNVDFKENTAYEVKVEKPLLNSFHNILWTLFSLGKFRRYSLYVADCLVATAECMPKIFIFGFMDKNAIHIGPCFTIEQYRGNGYYPYLLRFIISENNKKAYIFHHEKNEASRRGILKVGFEEFARGYKSKIGVYKISSDE